MSVQSMLNPRRDTVLKRVAADSVRTGSWPLSIGIIVFFAAAIALAMPLVSDESWYLASLGTVAAVTLGAQAVRQLTGNHGLAALGGVLALVIAVTVVAAPASMPDALTAIGVRAAEFGQQFASDQPPLRGTVAVSTVMAALSGALAVLADICALAWRRILLVPLTTVPLVILPVLMGLPPVDWWLWVAAVAALVLLIYLGNRLILRGDDEARTSAGFTADGRRLGGISGAITGGIAAIAAVGLVGSLLPPSSGALWNAIGGGQILSTTRVNPIIDLGDDLRRGAPTDVLRYATSIPEGKLPYISLTSLTKLESGTEWQPDEFRGMPIDGNGTLPKPQSLEHATNLQQVNYHFVMDAGVSPYLPKIGVPSGVQGVTGNYQRDERTGDIRETRNEALAQSFQSESLLAQPSPEEIAAATAEVPESMRPYLELPDDQALESIRAAMNEVVDPNATPFQQAQQLQQWMAGGAFTYSEHAPVSGGYDGTSLDVVAQFLQYRSGYCVHFASAMAVMGRMLNIPTRVQVGFTPGTPEGVNEIGQTIYVVTTDDLHAWAEYWVPGYGWVPMETTPSSALNQQEVAPAPDTQPTQSLPEEQPTPTPTPPTTPTPTPEGGDRGGTPTPTAEPQLEREAGGLSPETMRILGIMFAVAAVVALLMLIAGAPAMLRANTRRSRRQHVSSGDAMAATSAAWHEVLDTAKDYGASVPTGGTTKKQLRALAVHFEWAPGTENYEAASQLGTAYDAAWFGNPDAPETVSVRWDAVAGLRDSMREATPAAVRRRARWLPRSLVERLRANHATKRAGKQAAGVDGAQASGPAADSALMSGAGTGGADDAFRPGAGQ
ncbi:DUF3488 and transglutaminase-like domain-containing protein [Gulosibacter bifidus]|uniref:DUF3488 and transglutaminase-like domain-containing protein n=1 Tax=Gulosibacter bifidus TaxID=272239 RepID=A0ABW5RIF0_9MICO|nr:DUF3488 and transglutaminase-like domain-containing protein [Gulosibacter bifidus]